MGNNLHFLIEIQKLKEMPRRGLLWLGVKKPARVADHIFQTAIAAWILGQKKNLNSERTIKSALSHDLPEVFTGDRTPFWGLLPKNKEKKKEFLKRWIRIPLEEKEKRKKEKFEIEKKSLFKLINPLDLKVKKEIFSSWIDYEKLISKEGKFSRQVDQIVGMLEALESLGPKKRIWVTPWWEEAEELIDDELLQKILKIIQKKFYGQAPGYKKNKELENILDFILTIGKLKMMPRLYWTLRGIKEPETVAGHIFTLAIMAWVFGREKKLNLEKLLKMALSHELAVVFTGDTTPYDQILPKDEKMGKEILKRMIRLSRKEKRRIFLEDYQTEKKSLQKLVSKLEPPLKREIFQLWKDYRMKTSPESYFLNQLNVLAVLLQGLFYEKKYKKFSTLPLWEGALEICDDPISLRIMEEMKEKFYGR